MFELGAGQPAAFTAMAGFLLVVVFYGLGWWLTGRDAKPESACGGQGTPPGNLSPAALRYVRRMAADTGAAAAALMALAARGVLVMDWEDGKIRLRKCDGTSPVGLPPAESALAHSLLYTRSTLVLHNSACKIVAPALSRFRRTLASEHGRASFRANRGWLIAGLALSGLILAAAAAQSGAPGAFVLLSALASACVIALAALMQALLPRRYIFPEPLSRGLRAMVRRAVQAGFIVVVSPLAFVALADMISDPPVPLGAIAFIAALAGVHVVVYHLIKAPTVHGASIRHRIERFREGLSGGPPGPGHLPVPAGIYAFALDLPEKAGSFAPQPDWFRTAVAGINAPRGYAELGEALTRALDAASMPPAKALLGGDREQAPPAPPAAAQ